MTGLLGALKNLKLREVWKHEERDFTPWLAEEENMEKLSAALGLQLQLEQVEVAVGSYWADILAKDPAVGYVVIENQFGRTNHDHLGKLLTYAAALDAGAVVWIAEDFTEEHRKSLEWLNDRTTEALSIFAVQMEVLQIDESKPAIRFNVISRPSELVRGGNAAKSASNLTDAQTLQFEFWTLFQKSLLEKKVLPSAQTPRAQYWFDVALGRSNINLSNIVDTYASRIGVRVYIKHFIADAALAQLGAQRDAIEREIGAKLQWNPSPEKRDKIIALSRSVDLNDRNKWPEYVDWMVEMTAKFRTSFMPRIRAMKLDTESSAATHVVA
jgi:hypothetical protein